MDIQKAYSTIVTHLLWQNAKAFNLPETPMLATCMYRAPGGKKCAVGILIPDDKYDHKMEGESIKVDESGHLGDVAKAAGCETHGDAMFLGRFQSVHDTEPVDRWPYELALIGQQERLYYDPF